METAMCATGALELGSGLSPDPRDSRHAAFSPCTSMHRATGPGVAAACLHPAKANLWGGKCCCITSACRSSTCEPLANDGASWTWTLSRNSARLRQCLIGGGERQVSLDRALRWYGRQHKESFRSSDVRCRKSNKGPCVDSFHMPAWVDEQLAALYMQMGPASNWIVPDGLHRPSGHERGMTFESVSKVCQEVQLAEAVEALGALVQMGYSTSQSLLYTVLKRCVVEKDLALGRRVHALTVKNGFESDTYLCNHILRLYASHTRLQEAMDVFTAVASPDAFMWSSIVSAYVKHGHDKQAIQLYHRMRRSSVKPDGHVFVAALQACARGADLSTGKQVHADVLATGVEPDVFVCSCLVDMYAKCGSLAEAQRVFDGLGEKNVVTWTSLISGYCQQGMGQEALHLYSAMQEEGIAVPNSATFVSLLQACANVGAPALEEGKKIHAQINGQGLKVDNVIGGSLINMYAKCGSLEDAQKVFDGLGEKSTITCTAMVAGYLKSGCMEDAQALFDRFPQKDVVMWNTMIAGYSQQGMGQEALYLYRVMQEENIVVPTSVTFVCLLQACAVAGLPALETGKQLHAQIGERGLQTDLAVACSLVNMYAKCGSVEDAQRVFDSLPLKNVVTWNAMIAGYSQQGMGEKAFHIYNTMQEEGIAAPDAVTFVCLLQACATEGMSSLGKGKQLYAQIRERGLQADVFVANSLVNMYAKCGSLEDAQRVFDGLGRKNIVTWTAMIAGYAQQGMGVEALRLYRAMQEEGIVVPDPVTYVCLLQACANVAALHLGKQLHAQIEEQCLLADVLVAVSLINMYIKSGSMVDAHQVFEALPERGDIAWNSLIAGYTCQGDSEVVFDLFHRMRDDGIRPASSTFTSVLTVCSHAGLVNEGREYFEDMSRDYGITPMLEHYTCMVDLLGRAGQLVEALALVRTMPVLPDAAIWHTLLGACQKWNNVEMGRLAFDEAVRLDRQDAAAYVLMSNIYTTADMWEQAWEMHANRVGIGAWKQPGQSWWTDMDGLVHSFLVGFREHICESGAAFLQNEKPGYVEHLAGHVSR